MQFLKYQTTVLPVLSVCILLTLFLTPACKKAIYAPVEGDAIQLDAVPVYITPGSGQSSAITVSGIKANGQPMPDNTLVLLNSDSGSFRQEDNQSGAKVEAVRLTGGRGTVYFWPDPNFTGETVIITAQAGAATVSPQQLVITLANTDITQIFITADPLHLSSSQSSTRLTVTAYDSQSQGVPGKIIFLETSAGTLSQVDPNTAGADSPQELRLETDQSGKVFALLTTTEPATITATYKEIVKTVDITVGANELPTAAFEFSPQNPLMGEIIYFTSTSFDGDGTIKSHRWSFGDGKYSNDTHPTHKFPSSGEPKEYQVVLTVTDDRGQKNSVAQTVAFGVAETFPPVADFTFTPENPVIGQTIHFISTSTDEDDNIISYEWDFGDGSPTSDKQNPTHDYDVDEPTTFTVQLIVRDSDNNSDDIAKTITITADGGPENIKPTPLFTFSPTNPGPGETVIFNAEESFDEDGTIKTYRWNFGDGSPDEEGEKVDHQFNPEATKTFTVTLTVTDDKGAVAALSKEITVEVKENNPPVASFSFSPTEPVEGERVFFTNTSSDEDGTILTHVWDFGDGKIITRNDPSLVSHIYSDSGTFLVTLTVTDDDGATTYFQASVTVATPVPRTQNTQKPGNR